MRSLFLCSFYVGLLTITSLNESVILDTLDEIADKFGVGSDRLLLALERRFRWTGSAL